MSRFDLRPYQQEFLAAVRRDFREHDHLLGVAATGSGKTILASELMRGWNGNCLFLADAQELVHQNADKFFRYAGEFAGVEMADSKALLGDRVVVATTQSICRRLDKWPRDYFGLVIVDEAHRNTLGAMAAQVLLHFESAKVLGVTATPFRSDRRQLGSFYEKISVEIGLARLIKEGWLSRILIKSVPLPVDLSQVRTTAGDYNEGDLGEAIVPHLRQAARLIAEHAHGRRTVAFLPLIATSQAFVQACHEEGIRAVHVDGNDREGLRAYERGEFDLVSNASLLSTGWDHPPTDCVFILRPTKSLSLFQQMVGRGTRIAEGKENLLLLDPLFLTDDHSLIKPARLIARSQSNAADLSERLSGGGEVDLLEAEESVVQDRESKLAEKLRLTAKRKARTVDAIEFCLSLHAVDAADYEPELSWECKPPSDRQLEALARAGFDTDSIVYRGHASKILDLLFTRRDMKLATPKQLAWLRKTGHPSPETATFDEASEWLSDCFGEGRAV
ncbi:DEAD/DEAH box helicase [Ruficoccus amylovorans]|uniref:DEAD/DEAH box helicase n=1 Tax=Ruficoccus amylovorans TaxID=1804625 RepID=A0A842HG47_9BACT|nr:DEAD/DEAH box helicase [Ruficoccus amylovorans]MBC2595655.1 DEAD/DEAH box helicase [Ruficoccus amylovorans]